MRNRLSLRRHARALVDAAARRGDPALVDRELAWFGGILADDGSGRLLTSLAVPPAKKAEAVRALASRAGLSSVTATLLVALAERDRLGLVPALADAYRVALQERSNVVAAEVTTAVPLAPPAAQALADRLAEVSGKRVTMTTRVDPSLIGGVIARVGSTVYDGSVTGQLARMRQKLVENV